MAAGDAENSEQVNIKCMVNILKIFIQQNKENSVILHGWRKLTSTQFCCNPFTIHIFGDDLYEGMEENHVHILALPLFRKLYS